MKTIFHKFFLILLIAFGKTVSAQMVLEYQIDTANTQIALPLAGKVNVSVNWGDGSLAEVFKTEGLKFHTYATTGTKRVTITGSMTAFGKYISYKTNVKLTKVLSWDGLGLTSFYFAFHIATLLTQVPTSLPSTVTDLSCMFSDASAFNQPIGAWNTANVTNMAAMFQRATAFNQPIGTWNTSKVTDMTGLFRSASAFNQPIGTWNTAAVTNMSGMFADASAFNQPIGAWNTAKVIDMSYMFDAAGAFNQPIGTWNTAMVSNMDIMFTRASSFNQPLGTWNIAGVYKMSNMFYETALCTDNYDNLLNGWAPQNVNSWVSFGSSSKYSSASVAARNTLISKGWTISDAGLGTTADVKCTITGIDEVLNTTISPLSISPNPSNNGDFVINSNKNISEVIVTDLSGKQERFFDTQKIHTTLKGLLLIRAISESETKIQKVVVE